MIILETAQASRLFFIKGTVDKSEVHKGNMKYKSKHLHRKAMNEDCQRPYKIPKRDVIKAIRI